MSKEADVFRRPSVHIETPVDLLLLKLFFFCCFQCRHCLASHDFIFVWVNYKYSNESSTFSPG